MAVNKIVYNKKTLIDLTNDTVSPGNLLRGVVAHKADGTVIIGTLFNELPIDVPVTESILDSGGKNVLDNNNNAISGRIMYRKM